jgi:hypothetical protein
MAIDQPRRHPSTFAILERNVLGGGSAPRLGGRADPGDALALHREGGAFQLAIRFATRDHRGDVRADPYPVPLFNRHAAPDGLLWVE